MKPRHQIYLDQALSTQLETLAAGGATKSSIMAEALRKYLALQGRDEIAEAIRIRLDRLSHQLERVEAKLEPCPHPAAIITPVLPAPKPRQLLAPKPDPDQMALDLNPNAK